MLGKDWKSSASGILSFVSTTLLIVTGWMGTYMITAPASTQASLTKYAAILTLLTALVRGWIGLITTNADAGAVAAALDPIASHPAISIPAIPPPPTAASLAATPSKP
jgi:hypothetical protein